MNLSKEIRIQAENINFYYGDKQTLKNVNMSIFQNRVTAIIGPSGCGKSTFIRLLNRMNDLIPNTRVEGRILLDNHNIYDPGVDVVTLRRKVGMVFQKPNPFPKSIRDNLSYGLKINGIKSTDSIENTIRRSLEEAALWDEVKDRLNESALRLSGGQQQRLCIARAIAVGPEVILMDEPCSALDPIATARIEELIDELRQNFTIIIVTHSMQQAARVSQRTAFFHLGVMVEEGPTETIFTTPSDRRTQDYITGRFG